MAATDQSSQPQTVVSCPGKVLIGGGYLVLDPAYTGTVVATSSRFYAYFVPKLNTNLEHKTLDSQSTTKVLIVFRSPQFLNAEWIYLLTLSSSDQQSSNNDVKINIEQVADKNGTISKNPFLETAALESFRLGLGLSGVRCLDTIEINRSEEGVDSQKNTIVLMADNDFYSQPRDQVDRPPFNALNVPISEVHKTGLGSSAAMVTSICGAILLRLVPSLLDDKVSDSISNRAKQLIHNLAQYVHSIAQGKIGSGFDISAAIWGTHVYRRFSEECLNVLPCDVLQSKDSPAGILALLDPKINSLWNNDLTASKVNSFALPPLTTLMLADVDAGSHTPSMVGKLLKWRNSNPNEANLMWNNISTLNKLLSELCIRLNTLYNQNQLKYITEVKNMIQHLNLNQTIKPKPVSQEDDIYTLFLNLRVTMQETRRCMQKMGQVSDVPIEPQSQTDLLDECDKLTGVIGSGVPGAGGYDAIWVLVFSPPPDCINHQTGSKNVYNLWNNYKKVSVRELSKDAFVKGGQSNLSNGIRIQNLNHV